MKLKSVVALSLAAQFVSVPSQAQESPLEQVIVTATRAGEGVRRDVLGASITVLEPDDLEQRQTRLVSDVLRDVPGVAVGRAGTVGGLTQVRVRGTEGNHVLVLIDGMEASDPYSGEFDFAVLLADEVARIEVLRGQQSALYGSDAIGGVIHYMTASGKDAPGVRARVEAGSFDTVEGAARFAGSSGVFDYAVSAGYQTTDGVPRRISTIRTTIGRSTDHLARPMASSSTATIITTIARSMACCAPSSIRSRVGGVMP